MSLHNILCTSGLDFLTELENKQQNKKNFLIDIEIGYANMVEHPNMHLSVDVGKILNSTKGFSEDECILSCVSTTNCTNSNYYSSTKDCDVLSTDRFRDIDNFQSFTGAIHFSVEVIP